MKQEQIMDPAAACGMESSELSTIHSPTLHYAGIPWKDGGNDREGLDCRGLVLLWLREQMNFCAPVPPSHPESDVTAERIISSALATSRCLIPFQRGDVLFFRHRASGLIRHVAVCVGAGKILHIVAGYDSRIENGIALICRTGFDLAGVIPAHEVGALAAALSDPALNWQAVALLLVSIALSAASAFLMPKPKAGKFANQTGRYGFDQLYTQTSTQIPLPDLLGGITVAGNTPFQSLIDKTQAVSDGTQQKVNRVVILGAGPFEDIAFNASVIKINGTPYTNKLWHPSGMALNPAQSKAEAVDGLIGSDSHRPSITYYSGAWDITVPVDVRAQYDRHFPVYGLAGCAYLVFRLIDSTKFTSFNMIATVKGRKCRTYTTTGFTKTTVTNESLTGANGSKVRFKFANDDVVQVTAVTVNAVAYASISASAQTGNVYSVNKTKGYLEFINAPAAAATILVSYQCYARAWTQNPASHLVYLLTENVRGKGIPESQVDWDRAVAMRDYCDQAVTWTNASGTFTESRYTCNYAIDVRKPIQDHLRAVLDSAYACLFIANGKFIMRCRKAETSVMSFDVNNILKGSFSTEMQDRSQRANRVHLFYHSKDTFNAETGVVRDNLSDQDLRADQAGNLGMVDETLHMLAVDSETQAERLAETILRENVSTRWVGELKTNLRGLALEPMDVIDITHPSQPGWNQKLFRIEDISHDEEDRLTIKFSEYSDGAYF